MPGLPGTVLSVDENQNPKLTDVIIATVDLDECITRLYKKELLADSVIEAICAKTKELLMKESNVVHIAAPVTVVGDIHGQFFDLVEIFKIGGFCPNTNYLFLGTWLDHSMIELN
jgi:serine/threonine-protein phosphatase PPG1